jgi:Legionella pneumophila major outer membrane protein precursor
MKCSFVFPFSLIPFLLCAQTAQSPSVKNLNARVKKLEKEMKGRKWYNPPAGAGEVEGYHLFLIGDFLWMKAEEDGLTYSYKTNNPGGTSPSNEIRLEEMEFDWNFGFRVGGGFDIPHDHWDLGFAWMSLNTQSKTHKIADKGEGLFPYWAFPSGIAGQEFFDRANAKWSLSLNVADAVLGKDFYVGKSLSLHPFIGPRTAWIDQKFKTSYINAPFMPGETLNDMVHMRCDYWGLGPRAGLDMQWWLTKRLNIYATAAISLLYGQFHVHQKEEAEIVQTGFKLEPLHFSDSFHIARPITDLAIGFGWDTLFAYDRLHIGLKVGWEQHVFFDQNQFIRFVNSSTNSLLSNRGDLALEGLIASLRLDF